jgi:adenylate cyclase
MLRVANGSSKNSLIFQGGFRIGPGEERTLELPIACELGNKVVQVYATPREVLHLQTLAQATCAPGQSTRGTAAAMGLVQSLASGDKARVDEVDLLNWLQASVDVFQSAVASADFLPKAARATLQLVDLDTAAVLLHQRGNWTTVSVQASQGEIDPAEWHASQTMLRRVLEQRRTFFHLPSHGPQDAASLLRVQSLVASPFLDRDGNVIGVLYGERRIDTAGGNRPPIRELDAKLVELLAYGVSSGLARLEQERQLIAERVRFEQFFTPELARLLQTRGEEMLAAKDASISVLFCDIKGFSRISAACGAVLAIEWVCDVLSEMSDCVAESQGVLVDYSGDALEALWGAPLASADHAALACQTALRMRQRLPALNQRWSARIGEPTDIAIGIHSGRAQVGNIGSRRKYKYGALGTTVNLASRLQGATKFIGASLLVSGSTATAEGVAGKFALRRLCTIRAVNIHETVDVYALQAESTSEWQDLRQRYESALKSFELGDLPAADAALRAALQRWPDDLPSLRLAERIAQARATATPFDPVWTLEGK